MAKLGPKTRELLANFGLRSLDLDDLESGEVSWDIVDSNHPHPENGADLLLFHSDGGNKFVGSLTEQQVDQLISTSEFETREGGPHTRPAIFPVGTVDDWTGIRPNSDWEDLVRGYRQAVEILRARPPRTTAAPYLYLCRHLLELQLKAIIMLGQEAMDLAPDLPSHHDLQRLWTAAFPFVAKHFGSKTPDLEGVRALIKEYHAADPGSFSFRYPVTKGNMPVDHDSCMHSFSLKGHADQFADACDALDKAILHIRLARLFKGLKDVQRGEKA
jgi:hypothetical protein